MNKPDDITKQITDAVSAAVKPLQDQIASSNASLAAERTRADDATFRTVIGERFSKVGGVPKALDYIVTEAKSTFKVENGKVVAQPNRFSADHPGNPIDVDEWMSTAIKEHDFAFKPSQGGGAPPNGGAGGAGGGGNLRPGQTVLKNPTAQQLGEASKDISAGKVKVEYDEAHQ